MSKALFPGRDNGPGHATLTFELLGGGAAATLTKSTDAAQLVDTIARSAEGIFLVTMKDAWVKFVASPPSVDDTLSDGAYATIGDVTNEGTTTPITFKLRFRAAGGTLADPAAARRIGVVIHVKDTKS